MMFLFFLKILKAISYTYDGICQLFFPYGLKSSPAKFQRTLSGIIRKYNLEEFCNNYIDDVLAKKSVKYLRRVISRNKITPIHDNLKAISTICTRKKENINLWKNRTKTENRRKTTV